MFLFIFGVAKLNLLLVSDIKKPAFGFVIILIKSPKSQHFSSWLHDWLLQVRLTNWYTNLIC
jgi:hypothetical protein